MISETFQKFIDEVLKSFSEHEAKPLEKSSLDYKLKNYTVFQFAVDNFGNFNEYKNSLLVPNFSLKRNLTQTDKAEYDKLILDSVFNITMAEFNAIFGRSFAELLSRFINCNSLTKDAVSSSAETLLRALSYRAFYGNDVGLDFLCLSSAMSLTKIINKSIQVLGYSPPSEIVINFFNSLPNPRFRHELSRLSDAKFFLILNHVFYIMTLYSTYLVKECLQENSFNNNSKKLQLSLNRDYRVAEVLYASSISVLFLLASKYVIDRIPDVINEQNNIIGRFREYLFASISNLNVFRNHVNIGNRIFSRRLLTESRNQNSEIRPIDTRFSIQIHEGQIQEGQNNQDRLNSYISPIPIEPVLYNSEIDLSAPPIVYENRSNLSNRISARTHQSQAHNSNEFNQNEQNQNIEAPLQTTQLQRSRSESVIMFTNNISIRPLSSRSSDNQR
jgi:hypothetical protein